MPVPEIPTTKQIESRIISDIESKTSQATPLLFKAFNRVISTAMAGVFTIIYKLVQWAIKQIHTITQDADSLELKGDQYDIPRKPAESAIITADFTGDNGTIIDAGEQFRGNSNNLIYGVDIQLEIIAGTASGDLRCISSGDAGNLINGSILTILEPKGGLSNQATVSGTTREGEDQENIDDYRSRIQDREKLPPQGGALVDYIIWAKEVAGITRAFAYGNREVPAITPGYIYVYPISDNDISRIPSAPKLSEVQEYIDDPTRAPLQAVEIIVPAMTEQTFNVTVTDLDPNTSEIRTRAEGNIESFLLEREPQQFENQLYLKNVISRAAIESVYINSGAQSVTLTIDMGAGIIDDYTLAYNELAILGVISYV